MLQDLLHVSSQDNKKAYTNRTCSRCRPAGKRAPPPPSSPASLSALAPPGRTPVRSVVDVSPLGGCVPWRIATGDQRQLGSASTSADSKFTGKYSFEVDQGRIWGSGVAAAFLRILLCRCGATWRVPGRRLTKIDTVGCKQHTNAYACSLASHYGAS